MRKLTEHDVNVSSFVDPETQEVRIRADVRFAVATRIERQELKDAGDAVSAGVLLRAIERQLVQKLLENPTTWLTRPNEYVQYVSRDELIRQEAGPED